MTTRLNRNNTSGVAGVTDMLDGRPKCWQASIRIKGVVKVKYFFNKEDAVSQRIEWELEKRRAEGTL